MRWRALGLAVLLSGCGLPANVAVLIPDEDGTVGHATISNPGGAVALDQAFAAVGSPSDTALAKEFVADKARVDREFRGVLAATPRPPSIFIIAFVSGQDAIDPKSLPTLGEAIARIKATPDADISVVGHADRTGTDAANLDLSLRRATVVRDALVKAGVPADIIDVTYHGANNPVVPTAAGVAEPRNRRVEITIR